MSDTPASLHRKISGAEDLQSVVRTMKAMAASSIGQYENAVRSLDDYYRTVQLGLIAGFRQREPLGIMPCVAPKATGAIGAVVFGSDQGLVCAPSFASLLNETFDPIQQNAKGICSLAHRNLSVNRVGFPA